MAIDLDSSVDDLDLPIRAYRMCRELDIRTVRDLLAVDPKRLLNRRNFGARTLKAIRHVVHEYGWRLADETPVLDGTDEVQSRRQVELGEAIKKAATAARIFGNALWRVGAALSPGLDKPEDADPT